MSTDILERIEGKVDGIDGKLDLHADRLARLEERELAAAKERARFADEQASHAERLKAVEDDVSKAKAQVSLLKWLFGASIGTAIAAGWAAFKGALAGQ